MAYGLKYTSTFYNRKQQTCLLEFYEDSYSGASSNITVNACQLNTALDNRIISSSLDVVMVNTDDFHTYDDLLMNTERQYKAKLTIDSTMYFEGYLICDVSEQEILPYSLIRLTFTDYLKRLKDIPTPDLELGKTSFLIEILRRCLNLTGFYYDIRVNDNFFPKGFSPTNPSHYNVYELVELFDDIFYEDLEETQNAYQTLQDVLFFSDSYLYSYQGIWYIEQYSQINNPATSPNETWTEFLVGESSAFGDSEYDPYYGVADPLSTKYASINRQDDDFKYKDTSQVLQYNSGIKTLEITMLREVFQTLVYNNYTVNILLATEYGNVLRPGIWYASNNLDPLYFAVGYNYRAISKYFRFMMASNSFRNGIYTSFKFSYNSAGDYNNPTMLNINFKWTTPNFSDFIDLGDHVQVICRFFLMSDFNTYVGLDSNGFLVYFTDGGLPADFDDSLWDEVIDITAEISENGIIEINRQIEITSLSEESGIDLDQHWTIGFLPVVSRFANGDDDINSSAQTVVGTQVIGDIAVNISANAQENTNTYEVTDNFIKKQSVDLKLFDTNNLNYRNALLYDDQRTTLWGQGENNSSDIEQLIDEDNIVNHLAKSLFAYGSETRLKLVSSIDIDTILKPLTIITDDNIYKDSANLIEFILFSYSYDVITNSMSIEAMEYGNEEINIIES